MLKKIGTLVFILLMVLVPVEATKELEEVVLRNGERLPEVLVRAVWMNIKLLVDTEPMAFLYLIEKAKDPDYELSSNTIEKLKRLGFLESGVMHQSVRAIVLSTVEGEGLDTKLVYPVKPIGKSRKAQAVDLEEDL